MILRLLLTFLIGSVVSDDGPLVRINHGTLKGVWYTSTNGRSYAGFKGIPYAKPPIGENRFKEPQPLEPWVGVWNASQFLSHCLQYEPFYNGVMGSEDCLFVNVFTPTLNPGTLMPVVVFIPGGAFMYGGSSAYDPSHLMDRDVVVVTLNYRLGPLGTFNRGIAFSGSAFVPWAHAVKPVQKAKRLAAIVGCPTDSREMKECLMRRPGEVIVNAQVEMLDWTVHMFTPFLPTAEVAGAGAFLTQYPYHAALTGETQPLPLITSVTSQEGLYPAACYQKEPKVLSELETRWDELASNIFEYNETLPFDQRSNVAAKIKQHYLGGRPVSEETFGGLVEALGDRLFAADVGKMAQMHAERTGQPTYVYRYSYRGEHSTSNYMAQNDDNYGTSHGDDIMQLFIFLWNSRRPEEVMVRETLIDIVHSFATAGVPVISNGPEWLRVEPGAEDLNYLEVAGPDTIEMRTSADFGQKAFWSSLGFAENTNYNPKVRDEL